MEWYVGVIVLMLLGGVVYLGSYCIWITEQNNEMEEESKKWKQAAEWFERDMNWANGVVVRESERNKELQSRCDEWIGKYNDEMHKSKGLQSLKDKAEARATALLRDYNELLAYVNMLKSRYDVLEDFYWAQEGTVNIMKQDRHKLYAQGYVYDYEKEKWLDKIGNIIEPYYDDEGLIVIKPMVVQQ